MPIAVIDFGTNTFHLMIVEKGKNGSWEKIFKERITVKLGKGGMNRKIITKPAYHRGMVAVSRFRESLDEYNVKRVYAFGTAALRTAKNGPDFLKEAHEKFHINIQLISGEEEALLIYKGVREAVNLGKEKSLIMDIGGGSIEYIIACEGKIYWKKSFPLGAAVLLGRFNPSDPISTRELRDIRKFIAEEQKSLITACKKYKPVQLIGAAGSFETFASMIRHRNPESGSHYGKTEHPIPVKFFNSLYRDLIVSEKKDRMKMKGLVKMRVDMIVLAAVMLKHVLSNTHIKRMKLSAYALKEGALISKLK